MPLIWLIASGRSAALDESGTGRLQSARLTTRERLPERPGRARCCSWRSEHRWSRSFCGMVTGCGGLPRAACEISRESTCDDGNGKDHDARGIHTLHFPHDAAAELAAVRDLTIERSRHG